MSSETQPLWNKQEWYRAHADEARAYSRNYYRERRRFVSPEELEGLRKDILRALCYESDGKKWVVCLECGQILKTLSRHLGPEHGMTAAAYKEKWGYNKGASLMTPELVAEASRRRRESQKFREAQERNRLKTLAAFETERTRRSEARHRGESVRLGPMRPQARSAHSGRRLPARPKRQKVPDMKIQEALALDLPITEGAKRAGLSQTAFYRRAQKLGWSAENVRAKRSLITRYVFELRRWAWAEKQVPTTEQILHRHTEGLRGGGDLYRSFIRFAPGLKAELETHPEIIAELVQRRDASAVITLASRIFQRARRLLPTVRRGISEDTRQRIILAAACCLLGRSKRKMSPLLFPSSADAYDETKKLFRRHGPQIQAIAGKLDKGRAEAIISGAQR